MKRKLVLIMTMSLDGFIADKDGGYDWLNTYLDQGVIEGLGEFDLIAYLNEVDTIIMGKNCYNQGMHEIFPEKKIFVATSNLMEDIDNVHFIRGDISEIIKDEIGQRGKSIFVFGGGIVAEPFIDVSLIDEYIIGIVPEILGEGHSFFISGTPKIQVRLQGCHLHNETTILRYTKDRILTTVG